ncbi:hypothetical protein ACFYW8_43775 [Streptomyces sp. NPDC002742]|uniref:hypothetical protein n=1 Tax=Streptomyces sp. NPDC002742 TaxID=3364663 RepID=UPI0036B20E6C
MSDESSSIRARNPFLEALGRVTMAGAQLDSSLHHLVSALTHEPTLIFHLHDAGTDKLIQLCELALTVYPFEEGDIVEIKACLKRADKLRIRRNDIVHSLYMQEESGEGLEAMKPIKRSIGFHVTPITPEAMEAVADEIEVLRHDLFVVGWNARASEREGNQRIPSRQPGQKVNGVVASRLGSP